MMKAYAQVFVGEALNMRPLCPLAVRVIVARVVHPKTFVLRYLDKWDQ
jgi:hypothetical protein